MPYIKKEEREFYEEIILKVVEYLYNEQGKDSAKGHLNFLFTSIIKEYIRREGINYSLCNDMMGVLESCKQELYRRVVAPYEDKKIQENGDV